MKSAMKKWEGSAPDRKMDKKMGVKENSPADRKMDAAGAKRMMAKPAGKCPGCGKTLKNGACPGCGGRNGKCSCKK